MNQNYQITDLIIYPIKALGGIRLQNAIVEPMGLQHDRRYMLVDENNRFLSQREIHELCLFDVKLVDSGLMVSHKNYPTQKLALNFLQQSEPKKVIIWDDSVLASQVSQKHNQWFSDLLSLKCTLVKVTPQTIRLVDKKYAFNKETTGFSDGYPILIIGKESLKDLNSKLVEPIEMNRFRPNIVFSGGQAFDEDNFKEISINNTTLKVVKPCARCTVPTINQQTAIGSKEPIKTLATYRTFNNKILFGQNVLVSKTGAIAIGDEINI